MTNNSGNTDAIRYLNAHSQAPQNLQCFSSARAARSRLNPTSECRNGIPGARMSSACGPVSKRSTPTTLSRQRSGSARLSCTRIINNTLADPSGNSGSSSGRGICASSDSVPNSPPARDNHDISAKVVERENCWLQALRGVNHSEIPLIRIPFERGFLPCRAESRATPQPSPNRRTVERACFEPQRGMRASSFSSSERNAA